MKKVLSRSLYNKGRARNPGWYISMLKWMFQHCYFSNSEFFLIFWAYLEMFSCKTWKFFFILLVLNSSLDKILYTFTVALFFYNDSTEVIRINKYRINRLNEKLLHHDHALPINWHIILAYVDLCLHLVSRYYFTI